MSKAFLATCTAALVLLVSSPAYAEVVEEGPPTDNGKWVAPIAFLIFAVVVGGMLFLANAYRDKSGDGR